MSRRNTEGSEDDFHHVVPAPRSNGIPQYDSVDGLDEEEELHYVNEVEVKSNRGSTVSSRPRVTITQDPPEEIGERQVTVIEIASQRGSSRRMSPKKDMAPPLPLPEHPAQKSSAQQSRPPPSANKSNPEMAFDMGMENIVPVLGHKMNMDDRDPHDSVEYLNATFFEVFAEPANQYRSVACVWTLSFKIFEIVRIYSYKILTLIFGLLIAILGGFFFALFAFLNIWIVRPLLILARMAVSQILIVWPMFLIYVVRPCFYSMGAVFSTARLHTSKGDQVAEVWEKHIHHV